VGAVWILASAFCFTVTTSLVKYLGVSYSAPSQTFFAQCTSMLLLSPYTISHAALVLRPKRPQLLIMRSGLSTVAVMLAYFSYQRLPLANANALSFTRTLWIFPLAAIILGERLRLPIILAGIVAFGGVLLIGGVGGGHAQSLAGMAAGLGGAIAAALTMVTVRGLAKDTTGSTLLVWSSLMGIVFSAPIAFVTGWEWPRWQDLGLMVVQGAFSLGQQACYIKGLQIGEVSAIAPVDNVRIVFVILTGLIIFHEVPTLASIAGMTLIIGSALYVMWGFGPRRLKPVPAGA
jgi:drug/metabolite transporter (DMT)-like permease